MNEKIKVTSIASSSKGNCYHVSCNNTEFLIDAGISAKGICDGLRNIGTCIEKIQAIFITHEHIDHVKGLYVLTKKHHIPIHMTRRSADVFCQKNTELPDIVRHESVFTCAFGGVKVSSFFSSHDSADCVGYIVECENDRFGIATDTGYVDRVAVDALVGCSTVVLESNYDEKMLLGGNYPPELKERIKSATGHLSNYDCAAFARYLAENGTKRFMLGHLSEENNTPEIAFNITSRALKDFDDVIIKIAEPYNPTFLE